jgi:hypothetical protein
MARASGVNVPLILPDAPPRYDPVDQREVRRILMEQAKNLPDFSTITTIPAGVQQITNYTTTEVTQVFNPTRSSVVITTASLANLSTENGTIAMPFVSGLLLQITTDRSAWVRFYATAADRTADAARVQGTLATAGIGLLAEFQFSTGAQTVDVSPVATLANDDATLAKQIYYAIKNKSGSPSTVAITMKVLKLEGL